jgi:hypothetical protein
MKDEIVIFVSSFSSIILPPSSFLSVLCGFIIDNWKSHIINRKKMAKGILHLGDKGYGSDHLLKAQKNYVCKLCNRDIHKEELYARHSPNKFKVPLAPVCRDCAWWLQSESSDLTILN